MDQDHSNTIERMFRKLQEEEIVGININESWLEDIPVHLGEIPQESKSDINIVKYLNYPDSNDPRCSDFQSNNIDMFGFVQICSQPNDDTDNDKEDSVSFPPLESNEESNREKNAYSKCIALFKKTMDYGLDQLNHRMKLTKYVYFKMK